MFAEQMYCLGMYYNEALIGIEVNYSTYPEKVVEELGYTRLYIRQRFDTYTGKLQDAFGFETNARSRPLIIDELKDVAKHAIETIHDYDTLGEMLTFIYNDAWRPEAEQGEHDDLVMALAIANHIRCQQSTTVPGDPAEEADKREWTQDMWEDYNRADAAGREWMIRNWGSPK